MSCPTGGGMPLPSFAHSLVCVGLPNGDWCEENVESRCRYGGVCGLYVLKRPTSRTLPHLYVVFTES